MSTAKQKLSDKILLSGVVASFYTRNSLAATGKKNCAGLLPQNLNC